MVYVCVWWAGEWKTINYNSRVQTFMADQPCSVCRLVGRLIGASVRKITTCGNCGQRKTLPDMSGKEMLVLAASFSEDGKFHR